MEDVPESELRRVMETNFFGVLGLTRALLPTFRAQRRGRIVIVSSEAAFMGQPTNSIYCASKWAVEGCAEANRLPARAATGEEIRVIVNGDSIYISRHVTHTLRLNRPAVTGGAVD